LKCFSIDVRIMATAYILAETAEEAQDKADHLTSTGLEFSRRRELIGDSTVGDIWITGETYNRDMPEISLSPAMTLACAERRVDLVEDFDEEDEAEHAEG
jgi:hypothetical protein